MYFRNGSIIVDSVFTLLETDRTIIDTSGNAVTTVITDVDVLTEFESILNDIQTNPSSYDIQLIIDVVATVAIISKYTTLYPTVVLY